MPWTAGPTRTWGDVVLPRLQVPRARVYTGCARCVVCHYTVPLRVYTHWCTRVYTGCARCVGDVMLARVWWIQAASPWRLAYQ
jgi:hypothetical protein